MENFSLAFSIIRSVSSRPCSLTEHIYKSSVQKHHAHSSPDPSCARNSQPKPHRILKKISLQKIFGSNLTLKNRETVGNGLNPWAELRSTRQNPAKKPFILIAEPLDGIEPSTSSLPMTCSTNVLIQNGLGKAETKVLGIWTPLFLG